MATVEFADGPYAGRQFEAPDDDDLLTVVTPMPEGSEFDSVQIRYRRDGITSDGLPRFVQV